GPEADDEAAGTSSADNRPPTFYGAFKLAVDLIAEQYWRHFGVASLGVRPHVVYGPEREAGLTAGPSLAVRAAMRGEPYVIGYRGRVGYDYVEDVARAFVRGACETPPGANVVDLPGELAISERFAEAIERAVPTARGRIRVDGPEIPSNIPPNPRYIDAAFADWRATSLDEGVRRTAEFYADR
ncbi:MAG: NAD-dependent epimerase/dehydratase family protein, partial [Alphaproteobacteria bacterium]|nr:NAD-dependent epimerase/dehydratase family protein [Alphaproteobacteria bacterium]